MKENEYLLLHFKQLSGDISPTEALLLSDWLGQSPENQRIANEYTLVWEKSGSYTKVFSPSLDADFAKIQDKIQIIEQPSLKVSRFSKHLLRVAAALALLAVAVWGYTIFGATQYFDTVASAQQEKIQLVKLSDGTQVWLREGSSIAYANSFTGKKERRVKLTGEAYFEVAHDTEHPFKVEMNDGAIVEVLGTQFDVRQSEETTIVLVKSGKVRFAPNATTKSPVLTANQKAVFDRKANSLVITNTLSLNELAWQSGGLEFVKTPLFQVVIDLEQYYKVKISLRNPSMAACPHSAIHRHQTLKSVLDGLALTHQLKITEVAAGEFALSGGQCR